MKKENTPLFTSGTVNTPCGMFQILIATSPLYSKSLKSFVCISIAIQAPRDNSDLDLCRLHDEITQGMCDSFVEVLGLVAEENSEAKEVQQYSVTISLGRCLNRMLERRGFEEYIVLSLNINSGVEPKTQEKKISIPTQSIMDGKGIKLSTLLRSVEKGQALA